MSAPDLVWGAVALGASARRLGAMGWSCLLSWFDAVAPLLATAQAGGLHESGDALAAMATAC